MKGNGTDWKTIKSSLVEGWSKDEKAKVGMAVQSSAAAQLGDGRYDSVSEFIADASAHAVNPAETTPRERQFKTEDGAAEWYGAVAGLARG